MARPRKKRRKQVYDKLWDTDPLELARLLNIGGVGWIAQNFDCSPTTIWRATKAKGLKPGKGGKYVYQPPDPDDPNQIDDYIKMVDAAPRRGPSVVVIDAQVGRRSARPLSFYCDHEFERLEIEDRLGIRPPQVIMRCRHCWGVEPS